MSAFPDFVKWAGSQAIAGQKIGLSESMVSLILAGKRGLLPRHAEAAERASDGLFRCEQLMPGVAFIRDPETDAVTGHVEPMSESQANAA